MLIWDVPFDPDETKDYVRDWTEQMDADTDTILSGSFVLPAAALSVGLVADNFQIFGASKKVRIWFHSSDPAATRAVLAGQSVQVQHTVVTAGGRTFNEVISLQVVDEPSTLLLVVEDGNIIAGANSLVTLAFADQYFTNRPHADVWFTKTPEERIQSLIIAAKHLGYGYVYAGAPTNILQTLPFPRTGLWTRNYSSLARNFIPEEAKQAQCELAFQWVQADQLTPPATFMTGSDTQMLAGIKRKKLGPMELEYSDKGSYLFNLAHGFGGQYKTFPFVDMLLRPFLLDDTSSIFRRIVT